MATQTAVSSGKTRTFPRAGAWTMVLCRDGSEALGVITRLGKRSTERVDTEVVVPNEDGSTTTSVQPVPQHVYEAGAPFAEVHFVFTDDSDERAEHEQHGHTANIAINVPFENLRQPTYDELAPTLDARRSLRPHDECVAAGYCVANPTTSGV